MLIAGLIVLIICLILLAGVLSKRLVMNKNEWILFGIVLIVGLVMIAFGIIPPDTWDLSRHYEMLERMSYKGWDYAINENAYAHLPIINFIYAIVSVTEVYQLLPCLVVIVCYSIVLYVLKDTMREKQDHSWFIAFAILFNFAFCPFLHMVSGIRNILAYAICGFIFYIDIYKKANQVLVYVLYFATIFIHPSSILIVCIRILIPILLKWKWLRVFAVVWSLLADILVEILIKLPIPFLESVGWKLDDYLNNMVFSGHKILLVKIVYFLSILLIIEFYKKKGELREQDTLYRYICALEVVILTIIGSFRIEFIADRLGYFIAFAGLPVVVHICRLKDTKVKYIFYVESVGVFALVFLYQFLYFGKGVFF